MSSTNITKIRVNAEEGSIEVFYGGGSVIKYSGIEPEHINRIRSSMKIIGEVKKLIRNGHIVGVRI